MGQALPSNEARSDIGWLMRAMTRMVRPIVRFAVGRVSCAALVELVREAYVFEAREYLQEMNPDKRVTCSSLALLCGMDGRAIKAFEKAAGREYALSDVCSEAAILETWSIDPDFCDRETGEPARLLIHGPHATFQRLVSRAAGRAVTPQTALDRLLESGNIRLTENDTSVELIDPFFMPVEPSERTAIEAGSFAISRLGKAIMHNTNRAHGSPSPRWLQQDRWSTDIPAERLDVVRDEIRAILEKNIRSTEDYFRAEESRDSDSPDCSVGIGWYYWEEASGNPE